jgi:RHS repeat-associated protein
VLRRVVALFAVVLTVIGLCAAGPAGGSEPAGPPPAAGTRTVPHPDSPSGPDEYLPGTAGPGTGPRTQRGAHPDTGGTVTVSSTAVHGTLTLTPFVMGTVTSSIGGTVQGFFYVRTHGSSTWNIANGAEVDGPSGSVISWNFADQMGSAGVGYDWQMEGCQSGSCSALTAITQFGIDAMVASGNRSYMGYYTQKISNSSSLNVNYATGNLVIDSTDLSIGGINGTNLNFARAYNSITDATRTRNDFGDNWTNAVADLALFTATLNQIAIVGPSGYLAGFLHPGSSWVATSGFDADLTYSGSIYTLTFHHAADGFNAGDAVTFTSAGLVTAITDKHGNAITITYNPSVSGQVQTITDTQGRTVTLSNYNAAGQAQTVTDSTGRVLTYGYDTSGNLTSFADAGVHAGISGDAATQYSYDSGNRLTQITDPAGRVTKISYVGTGGKVATITAGYGTPSATTTQFAYYGVGSSICTAQPSYACTTVAQDRANATPNPAAGTYEKSRYFYDNSSRLKYVYDPNANMQATTWDVNSNVLTQSDKMTTPNLTTVTYDSAGMNNPLSIADPTGMTDTLAYTGSGHPYQPDKQTLPNTASTPTSTQVAYTYTAAGSSTAYGDVTQVTQGATTLQSTYQGDGTTTCSAKPGEVCTVTNGKSGVTSFGYDSAGNLTSVTPPSPLGVIHYTPDALGRDTTIEDGKSQSTTVHYDALDRVTEVDYPSSAKTITYTYDGDGNTTAEAVTTSSGTVNYAFTYDPLNRLTDKTQPANGTAITDNAYTYDLLGNLTKLVQSGGAYPNTVTFTENYTYNNVNLPQTVAATSSDPTGSPGSTATITLTQDADGRTTGIAIGSGETRAISYDNAGREVETKAVKTSGSVTLSDLVYCYVNPVTDCPTTPTGAPLSGGIETQLKQRATDTVASLTTGYTYDALSRLLTADQTAGGTDARTYGYDADGNRTSQTINGTTTTYTYNTADQATSTGYSYDAAGNGTATPSLSTLVYNTLNQTSSMTKSGTTANFTYAGGGQDTRTTAGSTDASLSSLGTDVEENSAGYHYYVRDPAGNLLAIINTTPYTATTRYPVLDGQGSVIALTNGTGTTEDTTTYDPYGLVLTHTGTDYNPYGYTSSYTDTTGLIHDNARYYNPADGRFTQQDPAGKTTNLYTYAGADPVNQSDTSGLSSALDYGSECLSGAESGLAIGLVSGADETGVGAAGAAVLGCGQGLIEEGVNDLFGGDLGTIGGAISDVGEAITDIF